ncbi:PKD domain-containing protein [Microbacterium sp. ARD32]|uniref:PKD domain-containing protein n=1 Tax=Microbacterium sp. ARD32 TaxID=2962577 RepID=UPI002880CE87|nr:PKD domain-containing protein [Microbacterium sp. ARD32]MDT0156342.1 PKD domain-containing protein [Microbacterium sp. ARD32]
MLSAAAVIGASLVVGAGATAAAADVLPGPAPIEQRNPSLVTADVLPTVQIDSGVVWTQVMHGNVVYAGGSFSQTRPAGAAPGTNLTPRSNLLAYDVRTGNLLPFDPQVNGTVKALALSPDGNTLYVGGTFTKVGSTTRFNVAAFDTATGALSATFKPAIGGSYVNAIVATDSTVYFGGLIGAAGGQPRTNFAAANVAGKVVGWAPTTDLQVDSMVMAPDGQKLVAAGRFAHVNNVEQRGLAALDLSNGALLPWNVANVVKNGRNDGSGNSGKAGIWSLTTDAHNVYGTGWVFADVPTGNLEGLFAADTAQGDVVWIADCHGDHYGVFSDGVNVYSTGHEHECTTAGGLPQGNGTMRNATVYTAAAKGTLTRSPYVNSIYADWSGYTAPAAVNWYPDWLGGTATGMGQAAWTVTGDSDYVVFGGEFIGVNNQRQQGLVRFARDPQGGAKQGPRLSGSDWQPSGRSVRGGTVDVVVSANWDRDDRDLTYELWEDGATAPAASTEASSTFWNMPDVKLSAKGLTPGSTHTYTVRAKDGDGNTSTSSSITVQVTSTPPSAYADEVLADGPSLYWRFNQPDPRIDWAGSNNAVTRAGYSASSDSAISGEAGGSATFDGSRQGFAASSKTVAAPAAYSVELWFKANSGATGKLIGYGSASTGDSGSYDRHVYLTSDGRLVYGNYPSAVRTVSTPTGTSYADASWHHVVATQSAEGMALYVDGELAANDPSTTTAQSYLGYWRIGGDNLSGWPSDPSSDYFSGKIDEVAVYSGALTAQQVDRHYALGIGNQLPTANFSVAGQDLTWSFDGSASTAGDGQTPTSYQWDFGDDSAVVTGANAEHVYQQAGTYTVTLTVTDAHGTQASSTETVTATEPHQPPTAVIGETADGLTVSFDSAASTAAGEATIAAAAWDFGDDTTSTALAPSHKYAQAGDYTVSLVVTDSLGAASAPVTATVTVAHADPTAEFSTQVSALDVNVDASESTASDDATLTYSWDWGDGSAAETGVTASHTYTEAGAFDITLTVLDSLGASATKTQSVDASDFVVKDGFERSVSSGWDAADQGGTWTGSTGLSVSDGFGKLTANKSQTRKATLAGLDLADFDTTLTVGFDKIADGGGLHFNVFGRVVGTDSYGTKLRIAANGSVIVNLTQTLNSAEALIATTRLSDVVLQPDDRLSIRFAVTTQGDGTQLKAKVWPAGTAQPSDWTVTAVSAAAALQGAGAFGVGTYVTGSVTNGPIVVMVDDVAIRATEAVAHVAPTAAIGATPDGLTVAFSATGSQSHDGAAIVGYDWDFGDGETSTEAAPSHVYAQPGTYTVKLVVTDSFGAHSVEAATPVTVTRAAPTADFNASTSDLTVSVDASSSKAAAGGGIDSFSWNWGDESAPGTGETATHTYASAGSYEVELTVTDSFGATSSSTKSVLVTSEQFVAWDDFSSDVASGWGTASAGGAWSGTKGLSVSGGKGLVTNNRSQTLRVSLDEVQSDTSDSRFSLSLDRVVDAGSTHVNYGVHRSAAGEYRAKLQVAAGGVVRVGVAKVVGTAETLMANKVLPDYTYAADAVLNVRVQTTVGGGSTTVQVKVWAAGTDEPSAWLVAATDDESSLQVPGSIALTTYVSGSATNGPVTIAFDDLNVR